MRNRISSNFHYRIKIFIDCTFFVNIFLFPFSVPIMPEYLYKRAHPNGSLYGPDKSVSSLVPCTTTTSIPHEYDDDNTNYDTDYEHTDKPVSVTTPCFYYDPNVTTTVDPVAVERRHEYMTQENIYVGLMFGSKALVQLITNPFVGPLTNRYSFECWNAFCRSLKVFCFLSLKNRIYNTYVHRIRYYVLIYFT